MISVREEEVRVLDRPSRRWTSGLESATPITLGYRRVHTAPGRSTVMKVVALAMAVCDPVEITPAGDNAIAEGGRPRK
jgi:hypothetical protein